MSAVPAKTTAATKIATYGEIAKYLLAVKEVVGQPSRGEVRHAKAFRSKSWAEYLTDYCTTVNNNMNNGAPTEEMLFNGNNEHWACLQPKEYRDKAASEKQKIGEVFCEMAKLALEEFNGVTAELQLDERRELDSAIMEAKADLAYLIIL